jgi:predicted small secreted protein
VEQVSRPASTGSRINFASAKFIRDDTKDNKEKTMKQTIFLLITLTTLAACNTMSGVGRDIEAAGEAITGTSEKTKEKMK